MVEAALADDTARGGDAPVWMRVLVGVGVSCIEGGMSAWFARFAEFSGLVRVDCGVAGTKEVATGI